MIHNRRSFIKKSGLAFAGLTLAGNQVFSFAKKTKTLSIQLYTVRDEMKANPLETLREIARIGYKNVEHANYVDRKFYGYTAKEFKKILSDLNLKMPSGHTVLDLKQHWDESKKDFTDAWKKLVDDAAEVGQQYVISPSFEPNNFPTEDLLKHLFEVYNKSGELCKKSEMKFGYHNHYFEFKRKMGDKTLYELLLENTDPKLVIQQLDVGHLLNGGTTANDIMKKYPNRFELLHVKDEIQIAEGKYESTILGNGVAQLKDTIKNSSSVKILVVEQEDYQGKSPIACAKEDFEAMKSWGY